MSKLQGINSNETLTGRVVGYGKLSSETAADTTDAWLRKGINYVIEAGRAHAVISGYSK